MAQRFPDKMSLFQPGTGFPILQQVPIHPIGGYQYIYMKAVIQKGTIGALMATVAIEAKWIS